MCRQRGGASTLSEGRGCPSPEWDTRAAEGPLASAALPVPRQQTAHLPSLQNGGLKSAMLNIQSKEVRQLLHNKFVVILGDSSEYRNVFGALRSGGALGWGLRMLRPVVGLPARFKDGVRFRGAAEDGARREVALPCQLFVRVGGGEDFVPFSHGLSPTLSSVRVHGVAVCT